MRCLTPEVCAAVIAASLSFFACLQGLQRLGSFFSPLSWKNACSPDVQMKSSLQSTHLMVRSGCSGCSGSKVVPTSVITSPSGMMSLPGSIEIFLGGGATLKAVFTGVQKRSRCFFPGEYRGERAGCPRTGGADGEKYNYGEIVSRKKPAYPENEFPE